MPQQIVFTAKNTYELIDCQDVPLSAGEIRGDTICSLISQGTELAWAGGDNFPIQPGYGAILRVSEVGDGVENVSVGDIRFCMGHHRSTQQYPVQYTLPVPDNLDPETAVIARLMGVSMTTLMTTKARPGDKVIITGAGPVGICAAHNFRIGGYEVAVVEPDQLRREQVKQSGIDAAFATMPHDDPNYAKMVRLVVDCSGHEAAVLDACKIVGQLGEVVLVGVPWKRFTDHNAHEIMNTVFFNFVNLRSGWEWEVPVTSRGFVWEELLENYNNAPHSNFSGFERALKWLSNGSINFHGLKKSVVMDEPAVLYEAIASREIEEPFIVIDWQKAS